MNFSTRVDSVPIKNQHSPWVCPGLSGSTGGLLRLLLVNASAGGDRETWTPLWILCSLVGDVWHFFLKGQAHLSCCFASQSGGGQRVKRKWENTVFFQESKHGVIIWKEGFLCCCVSRFRLFSLGLQRANASKLERFNRAVCLRVSILKGKKKFRILWIRLASRLPCRVSITGCGSKLRQALPLYQQTLALQVIHHVGIKPASILLQ